MITAIPERGSTDAMAITTETIVARARAIG